MGRGHGRMSTRLKGAAVQKAKGPELSKQELRDQAERLVKEAMERKGLAIKHGQTRIEAKCGKCGAPNRVSAAPGEVRVPFTCKECGAEQRTL